MYDVRDRAPGPEAILASTHRSPSALPSGAGQSAAPGDVLGRVSRLRRALDAIGHQALGTVAVPRLGATWYLSPPSPRLRVSCAASDAMLAYAFGSGPRPRVPGAPDGGAPALVCYPAGEDELSACYETVRLVRAWSAFDGEVPDAVLARLDEVLGEFWLWVVAGIDRDGCHTADRERNPMLRRSAEGAGTAPDLSDPGHVERATIVHSSPVAMPDPRGLVELFVAQRLDRCSPGWVSRARVSREFGTFLRLAGQTFDAPRAVAYAAFDDVLGERSRRGSTQGWRGWAFAGATRAVAHADDRPAMAADPGVRQT